MLTHQHTAIPVKFNSGLQVNNSRRTGVRITSSGLGTKPTQSYKAQNSQKFQNEFSINTGGFDKTKGTSFEQKIIGGKYHLTASQYVEHKIASLPVIPQSNIRMDYSNFSEAASEQKFQNKAQPLRQNIFVNNNKIAQIQDSVSFEIKDNSNEFPAFEAASGVIQNHMDDQFTAKAKNTPSLVQKYMANGFKTVAGALMLQGMVSPAAYAAYGGQNEIVPAGKHAVVQTISPAAANSLMTMLGENGLAISKTAPDVNVVAQTAEEGGGYNPLEAFTQFKSISDPDADLYRETPVRLVGYANEVGESFQFQFPQGVGPSYFLAYSYCVADALSKAADQYGREGGAFTAAVFTTGLDCLIWQCLASVIIPGNIIGLFVRASNKLINGDAEEEESKKTAPKKKPFGKKVEEPKPDQLAAIKSFAPTLIGLAAIPFIISPIDSGVDFLMDSTYRQVFEKLY